jgi:hypothetical protein
MIKYGKPYHAPTRIVRGKYRAGQREHEGDNWVQCDHCASVIRASEAMVQWNGIVACPDHWDIRNPGDLPTPTPRPDLPPDIIRYNATTYYRDGTSTTNQIIFRPDTASPSSTSPTPTLTNELYVDTDETLLLINAANSNYLIWEV